MFFALVVSGMPTMVSHATIVSYVKTDDLLSMKRTMTSILVRQHPVDSRSGRFFLSICHVSPSNRPNRQLNSQWIEQP